MAEFKILDLFCGLGGVAHGLQQWLNENNINYRYYAVDIDKSVLKVHRYWNKNSITICRDAYSFGEEELKQYDFIWASPPCQSHSRLNTFWKRYSPDMRLYELIEKLRRINRPFIVENVVPYYKPPIPWDYKIDRHVFWTNMNLDGVNVNIGKRRDITRMGLHELSEYHGIPYKYVKILKGSSRDRRQALRNMVNYRIAYAIAANIFPKILRETGW